MTTPTPMLPAAQEPPRGTLTGEELARIVERARTGAGAAQEPQAGQSPLDALRARQRAAEEAAERAGEERRSVLALDADAAAHRGAGSVAFARSSATVGAATVAGMVLAGPVGAVVGGTVGWLFDKHTGA